MTTVCAHTHTIYPKKLSRTLTHRQATRPFIMLATFADALVLKSCAFVIDCGLFDFASAFVAYSIMLSVTTTAAI